MTNEENAPYPPRPTFQEALLFWLRLGCIGFGGPAGQIAILHDHVVDKKRWISESKFLHALNYCMLLPGPEAQQLATYVGWLLHGTRGGLAAGILFVLPSMFIMLILSTLYVYFGKIAFVQAMFEGLKPAVVAIVLGALLKIGKKSLHSSLHYAIAALAFVGIFFFEVPFPAIVGGAILVGAGVAYFFPAFSKNENKPGKTQDATAEDTYYISANTPIVGAGFQKNRLLRQVLVAGALWLLPFLCLLAFSSDFDFWKKLILFFTKAAFVTIGGAYAVLPYVAQVSVEQMGWLTELQMIDGLALGETTPGPLIMVLAFVGFMAGHGHFSGAFWPSAMALVATTFYTFLPSFLFIFAGAPVVEKTQANPKIRSVLAFATAAVVGVVLNLALYFAQAVIFPGNGQVNLTALLWTAVSLFALQRLKINMIAWIVASALVGLIL